MNDREKALKRIETIRFAGGSLIAVFVFCLLFPPITAFFDRNDVWIGVFPLSQFYTLMFTGLAVAVLFVLYKLDEKYDNDELAAAAKEEVKE